MMYISGYIRLFLVFCVDAGETVCKILPTRILSPVFHNLLFSINVGISTDRPNFQFQTWPHILCQPLGSTQSIGDGLMACQMFIKLPRATPPSLQAWQEVLVSSQTWWVSWVNLARLTLRVGSVPLLTVAAYAPLAFSGESGGLLSRHRELF